MPLAILTGRANAALACGVAERLGVTLTASEVERFPDGELRVVIDGSVRGHDVYVVQPTAPPIHDHLLELLLLADAARRAGAARLTAVLPYFGYARQDRRTRVGEPVSARLVASLLAPAGFERAVAVDLHGTALEGFFDVPLEHLSAVDILARRVRPEVTPAHVVVAPDLGAVKLAERYAKTLGLRTAVVPKIRLSPTDVRADAVIGDVRGAPVVIVDDMISTGATVLSAIEALGRAGCADDVTVVVTHGLFVAAARERLGAAPIRRCVVTDSIVQAEAADRPRVEVVPLAELLGDAVGRLHREGSLAELIPSR